MEVPLRWRISRSTRPRDMSPRVSPDMIPAKRTRMQETPAYMNHQKVPNSTFPSSANTSWDEYELRAIARALIAIIIFIVIVIDLSFFLI